jgi:hypothetical protein
MLINSIYTHMACYGFFQWDTKNLEVFCSQTAPLPLAQPWEVLVPACLFLPTCPPVIRLMLLWASLCQVPGLPCQIGCGHTWVSQSALWTILQEPWKRWEIRLLCTRPAQVRQGHWEVTEWTGYLDGLRLIPCDNLSPHPFFSPLK